MTEPHDATNCDAFPLAVALAQAQTRIERLEAIAGDLVEALVRIEPWLGEIRERPSSAYENIKDAWDIYAREAIAAAGALVWEARGFIEPNDE